MGVKCGGHHITAQSLGQKRNNNNNKQDNKLHETKAHVCNIRHNSIRVVF